MGNADDQRPPLAGPRTEVNEQTVEKLVMAAWKETEKEHKSYVTERIKRRNEKLNKAHSTNGKYLHQWIRQDYQTPIATMKRTDGSITMNFQEIHQTLVESWRPIFARCAAGADSWKRCELKQFADTMYDQVADFLNTIEETASEMNNKELIETPICPEDIRTTPVANIKKEAESPGPRDERPITLAATLHCAWSSTRHRAWLHKTVHAELPGASVQNAIWPLLLKMEAMTKDEKEKGIATAAIDSEKHFHSKCWEVTFQILDRMGLDQRIWKPMLNFIAHLKRFNKVAGTLGPTWDAP